MKRTEGYGFKVMVSIVCVVSIRKMLQDCEVSLNR